ISLLARLYEHNRGYDVLLSRTADVTETLLQTERFHVLVIHAHPSKPGDIAKLEGELRSMNTRIVALIDGEVDASSAALYAAGADSVRQVAAPITDLADEVLRVSRADTLLEGRLDQVGTPELIQMLCLCRRSLMVRIETSSERGAVWLSNGEIHHAISDTVSGQKAMSRIVRADNGRFRAIITSTMPTRTIHQDWQHVMLEAAREVDEAAQQSTLRQTDAGPESGPPPTQSQVRKLGKTYRELTELGLQSIKAGDFSKAREYWAAARAIGPEGQTPGMPALIKPASSHPPAPTLLKATPHPHKRAERR
ncbi:MAG TPA: DUF4388 domain-containing protein, partial [Polyangiaceae bacterium]|nr:DUF4388 domain-containing protein [Polyangiaceae bacterium]